MATSYRILIVDDDPIFVEATRAVLESHGYHVDTAPNGDEALAYMERQTPDLVLLDVMMSWPLEGKSFSRQMLESPRLRDIPIVMCTSIRSSEYRGLFPQDEYLHIDVWLDKPCEPAELVSEIQATLARHERYKKAS